uniref:Uncharacterized protein n=1 Tax=Anguilla anguilla TaxID=7936 RepID=A0A0E9TMN6_ANGAN
MKEKSRSFVPDTVVSSLNDFGAFSLCCQIKPWVFQPTYYKSIL